MKKKNLLLGLLLLFGVSTTNVIANTTLGNNKVVLQEKEYAKIDTSDVPVDVLRSISAKYSGYSLDEAYLSDDVEYKVILSNQKTKITAFYKATGEFVKEA
ncbi:hypothetical protein [Flavobacterium sp.]|uniref:hypothetical protein n=1 Tax=Flavobacterium sp. TaxID=239 RepID=UPI003A92E2AC